MNIEEIKKIEDVKERTDKFFNYIMELLAKKEVKIVLQAKSVCVDMRRAKPEEVGTMYTTYSHGKVEKEFKVEDDTVFITTLDKEGRPIVDENGNYNIYDMKFEKFNKKYKKHPNGHWVQDQKPCATVLIPNIPEDGIELLPPNWGGYTGTLMPGGLVMLPYDPNKTIEENVKSWKEGSNLDWYPNNEAETYSKCDLTGKFVDPALRKTFGQDKNKADEGR